MKRREFIKLLGGAAAWPLAAHAQQGKPVWRVGVLLAAYTQTDRAGEARIEALLSTLRRLGWTDGHNIRFDYRWGGGNIESGRTLAAELVRSAPDAIIVAGDPALTELHRLTKTIPIVFTQVSDPVDSGFVASLARPGANLTGFQNFEPEMGGKWLAVLREAAPGLIRVGVLFNSGAAPHALFLRAVEAAAPSLGVTVTAAHVQTGSEIERAITAFGSQPDAGLIVFPHPSTIANRASISALAARHRMPAIYPYRYFATDGGLISYGPDQIDQWRGAAAYVDRILRGEKPSELPVQAPVKYEMVINLKTARALGLDVPATLIARADEVIE
jgi:putative tryptophan/tyrosine transport system substrate-binding protein